MLKEDLYRPIQNIQGQHMALFVLSGRIRMYDFAYVDHMAHSHFHIHTFHEFIYMLDGRARAETNHGDVFLTRGNVLSIPQGVRHRIVPEGSVAMIRFDISYQQHSSETISRTPHLAQLRECINDELYLVQNLERIGLAKVTDDGSCLAEIDCVARCLQRHYTGDYIRVSAYLAGLYIVTLQNFCSQKIRTEFPRVAETVSIRLANKAIQIANYICEHCTENITATTVAEALHYSKRHVQRILLEYYGASVSCLLKQYRVDVIEQMITQGEGSVEKLAARSGYSDPKLMGKHFKSLKGMSIPQYRAALQNGAFQKKEQIF